jgi:hypothetical protein
METVKFAAEFRDAGPLAVGPWGYGVRGMD